jgi:hypothetical protein
MATSDPTTGEVRRSPGIDAVQGETQTRLEPGRGWSQWLHGVDLVVIDDQRRTVGVSQPRHGQIHPLLGEVQFVALHRTGAVEDERHVEGCCATRFSLAHGRGENPHQQRRFPTAGLDQRLLPPRLDAKSGVTSRDLRKMALGTRDWSGITRHDWLLCFFGLAPPRPASAKL